VAIETASGVPFDGASNSDQPAGNKRFDRHAGNFSHAYSHRAAPISVKDKHAKIQDQIRMTVFIRIKVPMIQPVKSRSDMNRRDFFRSNLIYFLSLNNYSIN
jgi:hypothetical protein